MKNIIISVDKPSSIDGGILDNIFGVHQAISEAESKFWAMNLSNRATLGSVKESTQGYNVEFYL